MANKKKRPRFPGIAKGISPLQLFRRTLHSQKDHRQGLARARMVVAPSHFPMIVRELSRGSHLYETLLAPMTFPLSLVDVRSRMRLREISSEGEFMWNASVLSLYADRLKSFVKIRDDYYDAYVVADYDQANELLDSIHKTFGVSIWLLGNRLQLLQVTKGLEAQKTFLEEILSTEGVDQFIAWIAYFLSLRAEENMSYSSFKNDLDEVLAIDWLRDNARLHLLPGEFATIDRYHLPMSVEEPHPIIDRFETFIAMALSHCAKNGREKCGGVLSALELLEGIDDITIERMLMVLRDGYSSRENQFLRFADAFSEGRYEDVLEGGCDRIELGNT